MVQGVRSEEGGGHFLSNTSNRSLKYAAGIKAGPRDAERGLLNTILFLSIAFAIILNDPYIIWILWAKSLDLNDRSIVEEG